MKKFIAEFSWKGERVMNGLMKSERTRKVLKVGLNVLFIATFICVGFVIPVSAADPKLPTDSVNQVQEVFKIGLLILGLVAQVIGAYMVAYGVYQLIFGHRNDDPERQLTGAKYLGIGALLVALPMIVNGLKLWEYIGKTK